MQQTSRRTNPLRQIQRSVQQRQISQPERNVDNLFAQDRPASFVAQERPAQSIFSAAERPHLQESRAAAQPVVLAHDLNQAEFVAPRQINHQAFAQIQNDHEILRLSHEAVMQTIKVQHQIVRFPTPPLLHKLKLYPSFHLHPVLNFCMFLHDDPVPKLIPKPVKESLKYYQCGPLRDIVYFQKITTSAVPKEVLLKSINTIQSLVRGGEIYHRVINAIVNKIFYSQVNANPELMQLPKHEIRDFVYRIVHLSRFQPSFFPYPKRTTSIKKLFQVLQLDAKRNLHFLGSELINNHAPLNNVDLNQVELRGYLSDHQRHYDFYNGIARPLQHEPREQEALINPQVEIPAHEGAMLALEDDPVVALGQNYNPMADYPAPRNDEEKQLLLNNEIFQGSLRFEELIPFLRPHIDVENNVECLEVELAPQRVGQRNLHLKIGLINVISLDNILLDINDNERVLFIASRQGNNIFLSPYTPAILNEYVEKNGYKEPTSRLPLRLKNEQGPAAAAESPYWSIISKEELIAMLGKIHA